MLEIADNAAVSSVTESSDGVCVNVLRDEANGTVSKQRVAAANVQTEWLVVWTTVVDRPWAGSRSADRTGVLVDDSDGTGGSSGIRRTRNPVTGVTICPAVWTGQSTACTAHVGCVPSRPIEGLANVVTSTSDLQAATTSVFDDTDGVAGTVGDVADSITEQTKSTVLRGTIACRGRGITQASDWLRRGAADRSKVDVSDWHVVC